ncbi:hypothetical protein ABIB62_004362 [Mucilaginibacter sp. UYP25]|uniref:hypothetical protein n=1 Tax=unclassified Mucilaginibacter TaxID=2617802 RepID=UPI00339A7749
MGSQRISKYIVAFAQLGALNKVFHTRPFGRHALVNDSVNVYKVSHFSDMVADYRGYFKVDYNEIYLQFPAELWSAFLTEKIQLVPDDLIIELYKGWKTYWKVQDLKTKDQALSLEEFHIMSAAIQRGNPVLEAAKVNEEVFFPVIALTIKRLYANAGIFYADCVRMMTGRFSDHIGDGLLFVKVGPNDYPDDETYFVYTVDEDF